MEQMNDREAERTAREKMRAIALANLKGTNGILASILWSSGRYGIADNDVETFLYNPVMKSDEMHQKIFDYLKKGRSNPGQNGGNRYTGTISESQILSDAAAIATESFYNITAGDLAALTGIKIPDELKGRYLKDINLRDKIFAEYKQHSMDLVVANALMLKTQEVTRGKLEKLLVDEVKPTIGGK